MFLIRHTKYWVEFDPLLTPCRLQPAPDFHQLMHSMQGGCTKSLANVASHHGDSQHSTGLQAWCRVMNRPLLRSLLPCSGEGLWYHRPVPAVAGATSVVVCCLYSWCHRVFQSSSSVAASLRQVLVSRVGFQHVRTGRLMPSSCWQVSALLAEKPQSVHGSHLKVADPSIHAGCYFQLAAALG